MGLQSQLLRGDLCFEIPSKGMTLEVNISCLNKPKQTKILSRLEQTTVSSNTPSMKKLSCISVPCKWKYVILGTRIALYMTKCHATEGLQKTKLRQDQFHTSHLSFNLGFLLPAFKRVCNCLNYLTVCKGFNSIYKHYEITFYCIFHTSLPHRW